MFFKVELKQAILYPTGNEWSKFINSSVWVEWGAFIQENECENVVWKMAALMVWLNVLIANSLLNYNQEHD